jgi:hypothetical protein
MNRCYVFPRREFIWCPPRHLAVAALLTQLLWRFALTHRRIIRCLRLRNQKPSVGCLDTVRWTATEPSVHLVLLQLFRRVSILIQTRHQIDWRFNQQGVSSSGGAGPCELSSSNYLTHLERGPSDHRWCTFVVSLRLQLISCFNLTYLTCHHLESPHCCYE